MPFILLRVTGRVDSVKMEGCWDDQISALFECMSFTASADVHHVCCFMHSNEYLPINAVFLYEMLSLNLFKND